MQVSMWMLSVGVGASYEDFILVVVTYFYGLFCNRFYKQFIIVIIERCGFYL